eukprot:m.120106 g.120106  ORF g.120106 m.120106 type:complete len:123 (-) comp15606_c0_seq2:2189-2557(-)
MARRKQKKPGNGSIAKVAEGAMSKTARRKANKELASAMDAMTFAFSSAGSDPTSTKAILTATAKADLKRVAGKKSKVTRAALASKRRKQKSKRMAEVANDRIEARLEKAQRKQTVKKMALKD